ncbi:MAG: 2-C-methyl-D-erythritol 4-phosphate cytidylyltransferase [Acidaminococcaceae bacterium]|nr:2-C-methyl-D-erythritol 4-phosphate cytidylyltransferase [Acidaminococcaceae bacterium]
MKELLTVIVPAAGAGRRMGLGKNKAFVTVGGIPLLVLCLKMLSETQLVRRAIVVVGAGEIEDTEKMLREYQPDYFPWLSCQVTAGGKERQDSVANGLALITDAEGYVAVHDGARPFAGPTVFSRTFAKAKECGAAIAAVPMKDTVKITDSRGFVVSTPDRSSLCAVQTPQIFEINVLRRGYAFLKEHPFAVTDDASLVEAVGHPVAVAEGDYENIKVTTPEDLLLAEKILEKNKGNTA